MTTEHGFGTTNFQDMHLLVPFLSNMHPNACLFVLGVKMTQRVHKEIQTKAKLG
jgi:hypothetical protein